MTPTTLGMGHSHTGHLILFLVAWLRGRGHQPPAASSAAHSSGEPFGPHVQPRSLMVAIFRRGGWSDSPRRRVANHRDTSTSWRWGRTRPVACRALGSQASARPSWPPAFVVGIAAVAFRLMRVPSSKTVPARPVRARTAARGAASPGAHGLASTSSADGSATTAHSSVETQTYPSSNPLGYGASMRTANADPLG